MVSEAFRSFLEELSPQTRLREDLQTAALETLPPTLKTYGGASGEGERMRFLLAAPLSQLEEKRFTLDSLERVEHTLRPQPQNWVRQGLLSPFQVLRLFTLEARILRERFPTLLLQRERKYIPIPLRHPLLERFQSLALPASGNGTLRIQVRGTGDSALEGVEVHLFTVQDGGYRAHTDTNGLATLTIPANLGSARSLVLELPWGYWSKVILSPKLENQTIVLNALELEGFGWRHRLMRASETQVGQGQGVKVGVVDSGIAAHPALEISGGQSFV